jgi:acyl carrier protein
LNSRGELTSSNLLGTNSSAVMERQMAVASVFDRLTLVLREVFDDDDLVATAQLTAPRVNGWDSLGNVRLFLEVEREFSVRFSATEITSLKNVGQLAELIEAKTRDSDDKGSG